MDQTFDFAIIGAGPAGEAAAYRARALGASAAVIDAGWFGGSCPHIGCLPSKSLLHAAAVHASGATYPWSRASERRDWIVNRPLDAPEPDDRSHVDALRDAGAVPIRGRARIVDRGRVVVDGADGTSDIRARDVIVAVGSTPRIPPLPGLDEVGVWTNREATLARTLPGSMVVLGGGPTACELAQVFARFGVPITIVQSRDRLVPTDHPRNAETILAALRRDGVDIRLGHRAVRARAAAGRDGAHVVELADGSTAEGHVVLAAIGRSFPLDGLGLEVYGLDPRAKPGAAGALPRDGRLRVADGLWVVGDPAGPELHTHQAHYQGELAVRMALGEDIGPDYRALPRATYTDPEAAFVGLTVEGAREAGHDAVEFTTPFATTARGYGVEEDLGHLTIVVDRRTRELVGAAIACPDASAAIHECVLAIQARIPVDVLAATIHAFPSTARALGGLFVQAAGELGPVEG